MKPRYIAWAGAALAAVGATSVARAGQGAPSGVRATVDKYCVTCHNERQKTGGLVLERVDLEQESSQAAALREKVIRKVRAGAMPPARSPRPDETGLSAFVQRLEDLNDQTAKAAPNPGRPMVHRLNRAEYTNAVRDLLGIEIDAAAMLPADDSSYGFDNVADVLSMSQGLLDRYLHAARRISRLAVGDPAIKADVTAYKVNASLLQDDRMSEDLPFGSRGGLAIRHHFPTDGEYELRVTLQRNNTNMEAMIRGLDTDALIQVRLDGARLREVTVDASAIPREAGIEKYKERAYGEALERSLSARIPIKAGPHAVAVTLARSYSYAEGVLTDRYPLASDTYTNGLASSDRNGKIDLEIALLEVVGPFNGVPQEPARRSRIFSCAPGTAESACATSIVSRLARLAFRRPVTAEDTSILMPFYHAGRERGGFEEGVRAAVERILVSPQFLFRQEDDPPATKPGSVVPISDLDLASRLSFFLWSSIPDDELLKVAASGRLRAPEVLRQQVVRMLRDPRATAMRANFFGQWLYLRNLAAQAPDPRLFPKFDEGLRQAFQQETALFLESQLREDRPVLELFTAEYTFVNERLAGYYGIPNVTGNHFRRVALPANGPRAGILGQGSILTVTSYAHRTSPVVRGKWLLENILGNPPPAPPDNVPPFPENDGKDAPKTVRARLEQHRRNPVCATCHSQIDPLGFALENFDATGQYRVKDSGNPVDASGTLPDGSTFSGPAQFRQVLLSRRDQLMRTLTAKLLTYALGRGVEYYDQPAVRQIIRDTSTHGGRWSSLIAALVQSVPFQYQEKRVMIVTRKHVPRRTILRGLGTSLALPLLDSMVPAFGSVKAAAPVKRFGAVYVPMGRAYSRIKKIDYWTPKDEGKLTELSPILAPLAPVKDRALVVTGLGVHVADIADQGPHPRMQTAWLTGVRPRATEGADLLAGTSLDQILAREIGQETQLDSLQIGIESADTLGNCSPQYSCTYTNTISWRTPTSPLPMETSPRAIFERLFGTSESTEAAARVAAARTQRSILDSVAYELSKFQKRVATADRQKMDQYTEAIRDIERRLQKAEVQSKNELPTLDQPSAVVGGYAEHVKLMADLIVIAYQADMSRVFSFLMAREGTYRPYPEIGVPDSHHPVSHHGDRVEQLEKLSKINTYHVSLFTYLIKKLAETPDGDGTLLDGTVMLYGSGMGDPNAHLPLELPTLLISGSKIDIQAGRHVRYPTDVKAKLSALQLLVLDRLGVRMDQFGDATEMLRI